ESTDCGDGSPLGRGGQIVLVGKPFGVEGEDISSHRPGIDQRDGEVPRVPGTQLSERWTVVAGESGDHALPEPRVRAGTVGDFGKARPVGDSGGCLIRDAAATTAA